MLRTTYVLMICLLHNLWALGMEKSIPLADFSQPRTASEWQNINDGVMGGVSDGRFRLTGNKSMEFYGTLSLENNGGFASVRTKPKNLALQKGDVLLIRVKGDGREYSLNLYSPKPLVAFSYRMPLQTQKDVSMELKFPLDKFTATSFGRVVPNAQPLDPSEINGIGFLLGDKKAGPFRLEIESISILRD